MPDQQLVTHAYEKADQLGLSSLDARTAIQHATAAGYPADPKRGIGFVDAYLGALVSSGAGS